jgi:hypothetical protein
MSKMQTLTISFHEVTSSFPTATEIQAGIYALNKMTGDLVKIPLHSRTYDVTPVKYSLYAPASALPDSNASKYDEKYKDLVKAKEVLKADRYGYDNDSIGKAIGLIKRFLDTHGKI